VDRAERPAFTKCLSSFELTANLKNNPPLRHDPLKFPGAMAIQLAVYEVVAERLEALAGRWRRPPTEPACRSSSSASSGSS